MTTGGRRLLVLREMSRLGDESRDEGLEERECEDIGLVWSPLGISSAVTMRERPDTDADLGTLHVKGDRGFSRVSCWSPRRRGPL